MENEAEIAISRERASRDALAEHRKGPAFCRAAFESLHISIGGAAKPCCEFEGDFGTVRESSVEDIWHAAAFQELRAKMLRGERDDRCRKCYEAEEAGGASLRDYYNSEAPCTSSADADSLKPDLPRKLDLRFSNLCNLSCRTCGPDASTKWFAEAKQLGWWKLGSGALVETFVSKPAALQLLGPTLENVEAIYFAGGEPLLHEQHYAVLQDLIDRGRTGVRLNYHSNMMQLGLGPLDVVPLWSRFQNVAVMASIDGHKTFGELVREGLSWDRFTENVATLRQKCPHVHVSFAITVSVFNVLALPSLCEHLQAIVPTDEVEFYFNVLQEPRHYSIQILPANLKNEAKRRLEKFAKEAKRTNAAARRSIQPVINYMMFEDRPEEIARFRMHTLRLDEIRGRNTAEAIPELAPLLRRTTAEKVARVANRYFSKPQK